MFLQRLLLPAVLLVGAVCSSTAQQDRILPDPESALIVTVTGDDVKFTWQTKPGRTYQLMASDRASSKAPWFEVPGTGRIEGDGSQKTLQVRIPNAQQYRYSLRTFVPEKKRSWWRR